MEKTWACCHKERASERERLRATVWGQREGPYRLRPGSANKHGGGEVEQQMMVGVGVAKGRRFMARCSHMAKRILDFVCGKMRERHLVPGSDLHVDPSAGYRRSCMGSHHVISVGGSPTWSRAGLVAKWWPHGFSCLSDVQSHVQGGQQASLIVIVISIINIHVAIAANRLPFKRLRTCDQHSGSERLVTSDPACIIHSFVEKKTKQDIFWQD